MIILSRWAREIIHEHSVTKVFMEGYAFGATGRVFQIAENTGSLKYQLWKEGLGYDVYPPSMIKKFATGKGNANKEKCGKHLRKKQIIISLTY